MKTISKILPIILFLTFQMALGQNENVGGIGNNSPTPDQAIAILYTIIIVVALIIIIYLYLIHKQRLGEQKIVLEAIQNKVDIPLEYIQKSKKKKYQRNAIVVAATGIGMLLASKTLNLPFEIPLLIVFTGIGFFVAGRFIKD